MPVCAPILTRNPIFAFISVVRGEDGRCAEKERMNDEGEYSYLETVIDHQESFLRGSVHFATGQGASQQPREPLARTYTNALLVKETETRS